MRWRVQALLDGLVCGSAGEPGNANDGDSVALGDMRCNVTKQRKSVATMVLGGLDIADKHFWVCRQSVSQSVSQSVRQTDRQTDR